MLQELILLDRIFEANKNNDKELIETIIFNDTEDLLQNITETEQYKFYEKTFCELEIVMNKNLKTLSEGLFSTNKEDENFKEVKARMMKTINDSKVLIKELDRSIKYCLVNNKKREVVALTKSRDELINISKSFRKEYKDSTLKSVLKYIIRFFIALIKIWTTNRYFYISLGLVLAGAATATVLAIKFAPLGLFGEVLAKLNFLPDAWTSDSVWLGSLLGVKVFNFIATGLPSIGAALMIIGGVGLAGVMLSKIDKILQATMDDLGTIYVEKAKAKDIRQQLEKSKDTIEQSTMEISNHLQKDAKAYNDLVNSNHNRH